MSMMTTMSTHKIKDVRHLSQAVEEREMTVKHLYMEHSVTADAKMKVALLKSMVPSDLQDHIFQEPD